MSYVASCIIYSDHKSCYPRGRFDLQHRFDPLMMGRIVPSLSVPSHHTEFIDHGLYLLCESPNGEEFVHDDLELASMTDLMPFFAYHLHRAIVDRELFHPLATESASQYRLHEFAQVHPQFT